MSELNTLKPTHVCKQGFVLTVGGIVLMLAPLLFSYGAWALSYSDGSTKSKSTTAATSSTTSSAAEHNAPTAQEQRLYDGLQILQAIGSASNNGEAGSASASQACSMLQGGGDAAFDRLWNNFSLSSNGQRTSNISKRFEDLAASQGRSGMQQMLSMACNSLMGQETGGAGLGLDMQTMQEMGVTMALNEGLSAVQSSGLPFTTHLEVESGYENHQMYWEALTVQPLWSNADDSRHIFTQLSWNHQVEDGDTVNGGLAYRWLNDDRTVLYGVNTFIDHALEMNHNRMSIGADIQTSQLGLSYNRYIPLSGWKSKTEYIEERAARGWDLELQGRVPQLPSWQALLRGYHWSSNEDGEQEDTYGYDAGVEWRPVNGFAIETGINDEHDADPEMHAKMRLVYTMGQDVETLWDKPVELASMQERVFGKVRRENIIRTEQRMKQDLYLSVLETTGANTATLAAGQKALSTGLSLERPVTIAVSAVPASIARIGFRDGARLTIAAGSSVRIESNTVTLLSGSLQFVSGSTITNLAAPGATIDLLGTDVDISTDGTITVLRVRDGAARITGTASGSTQLNAGEAAASTSGAVGGSLATNNPTYINHTDTISTNIDRVATPQTGGKIAPYTTEAPRLVSASTTPGDPITIGLKFNQAVSITGGPPQLTLLVNGNARTAPLTAGQGTDDLIFTYTLQPADEGATAITVQGFDANGASVTGSGKDAVITIADTTLDLMGTIPDVTGPSGYTVAFTTTPVDATNYTAAAFRISNAEIGATYNYTISSDDGGTDVTGSGTISTATQDVTGIDVSGLNDGTLTVDVTLTDPSSNEGAHATNTATKSVITLAMNFAGGSYSYKGVSYASPSLIPDWQFSRNLAAYAEDSSGNLTLFPVDTPRITDKGLLIEGQRTNYLYPTDMSVTGSAGSASLTLNQITGPDGNMSMEQLNRGSTGSSYITLSAAGLSTAANTVTFSIYAKAGTSQFLATRIQGGYPSRADVTFDLVNGTVTRETKVNYAAVSSRMEYKGNGIYRCIVTTTTDGTGVLGRYISAVDDGTSVIDSTASSTTPNVYVFGPQLELGSYATSLIPTTTTFVTRPADVAGIGSTSGWFNPASGTLAAEFSSMDTGTSYHQIANISGADGITDRVSLSYNNQKARGDLGAGGVLSVNNLSTSSSLALNTTHKAALTYLDRANILSISANGSLTSGNNSGSGAFIAPNATEMTIGNRVDNRPLDGWIRELDYYPSSLTDAKLQAITQ